MGMQEIKELRERTGAGILDCKKALAENASESVLRQVLVDGNGAPADAE